ncbi:MAG: rhomboid family intramembrane serine protease [Dehalococcoidia bacterium]|nr:rhomboid family intramembrane serine protease [Dehalococcoidia bacterium]MDD5495111.1 rhomboid family intramembrane serine protease [Dehalococcoidia bacterium]
MRYRSSEGELIPIIVIVILNFLVYLAINVGHFMEIDIIPFLGLSRITFLDEPWTILTCMFTHQGFFHLLANMLTLYFFGSFLTRITGLTNFLLIYFIGGIVSGLFVLGLSPANSITIGASGAVFALGGALAVLTPREKVFVFPIPAPMPLWVAVIIGFLVLTLVPGVSWQGHLGGLLSGLLAGLILRRRLRLVL